MGKGVLIDTDVLIDYIKGLCELPKTQLYISEIVLYEFIRGTKDIAEAKKTIEESFAVLFHDNRVIGKAASIWVELRKDGKVLDDRDILIAATAIVNDLELLSRNVGHYRGLVRFGLKLFGGHENSFSER